jgi:hypothetical protein
VSAQENEALVRRYFDEGWGKGNVATVDEFMAPNYVEHQVPDGQLPGRDYLQGDYGDDRLIGDLDVDFIDGYYGDDKIWARDGSMDTIYCGPGTDTVNSADMTENLISSDCESVTRF